MDYDFLTVFYSKTRFERVSFYVGADMSKEYTAKPDDFYSDHCDAIPDEIRGEVLKALERQWDFIIDIRGKEVVQIKNYPLPSELKPLLNARAAESDIHARNSNGSLLNRVMKNFGYRK